MAIAKKVAVYGSGPAGLMAATRLRGAGAEVHLFERRPSYGRKLLIAGSSGLNITHDAPVEGFIPHYQGFTPDFWRRVLTAMSPQDWIDWIRAMGFETFAGTSGRWFVREMKASNLLKAWIEGLKLEGVVLHPGQEWRTRAELDGWDAVGFFLGGGSWEESTPGWLARFPSELGVATEPFYPTNAGYEVAWSDGFLQEAEGKPLKNIVLTTASGEKAGELVVTRYGLEGTPVYFHGTPGPATLDLKPGLTQALIRAKLLSLRENLSPLRRIKKQLQLGEAALALLFHHTPDAVKNDLESMIKRVKAFPLELLRPRPLSESISSGGGVRLDEVMTEPGRELMLRRHPGWFCGGEMLAWTAPTGGFLIQGCVSQGALAADNIARYLGLSSPDGSASIAKT